MPVYASVDDYIDWSGLPAPTEIPPRIMAEASDVVSGALIGAVYEVDAEGLPTGTDMADVLRVAACAQARPAVEALCRCDDPKAKPMPAPTGLTPEAYRALRVAGLLPVRPWVVG